MLTIPQLILIILNAIFRILIFVFFWLASNDVTSTFSDRQLSFVNELWSWQQNPIVEITKLTDNSECPKGQIPLTNFIWPGRKSYVDAKGDSQSFIDEIVFNKWTTTGNEKFPFILCGTPFKTNFVDYASSNLSCSERNLKDCGNGDNVQFCISTSIKCPITSFTITASNDININRDNNQLPMALTRIDSFGVCITSNNTNIFPNYVANTHLIDKWVHCSDIDQSYIGINSISDQTYYEINGQLQLSDNQEQTKTLFYQNYPYWNQICNGDLFKTAIKLSDLQAQLVNHSSYTFFFVILYLLICNYAIPAIPFICRCIEQLSFRNILYYDYAIRIAFSIFMFYYSFQSYVDASDIVYESDKLIGQSCVKDETNISRLNEEADYFLAMNLLALLVGITLWTVEGLYLSGFGCKMVYDTITRKCKKLRYKKHLQQYEQVNLSNSQL